MKKKAKKKPVAKKKGSKKKAKDAQLRSDVAGLAEVVMSILSNGLAKPDGPDAIRQLQATHYERVNEIRNRWGLQL